MLSRALRGEFEHPRHLTGQRAEADQLLEIDRLLAELADRDVGAVQRQRREHDVDARAVLQPRVHHRARLVDAPPDRRRRSAGRRSIECAVSRNRMLDSVDLAAALDEGPVRPVHHDVGDRCRRPAAARAGRGPVMSLTSCSASSRCSRAFSWMRRSVAISEISRSTSIDQPLGRHRGDGGRLEPGQAERAQFGDRRLGDGRGRRRSVREAAFPRGRRSRRRLPAWLRGSRRPKPDA